MTSFRELKSENFTICEALPNNPPETPNNIYVFTSTNYRIGSLPRFGGPDYGFNQADGQHHTLSPDNLRELAGLIDEWNEGEAQ